jgi:hypothetical protein
VLSFSAILSIILATSGSIENALTTFAKSTPPIDSNVILDCSEQFPAKLKRNQGPFLRGVLVRNRMSEVRLHDNLREVAPEEELRVSPSPYCLLMMPEEREKEGSGSSDVL